MKKYLLICIVLTLPSFANASTVIAHSNTASLSTGLVGYWPLDGNTLNWQTGRVTDMSGSGNTGQMTGMSTTTSPVIGRIGQALKFNGANSQIQLSKNIPFGSSDFTISLWFKTTLQDGGPDQLWISGYDGSNTDLELAIADYQGEFYVRDASGAASVDLYSTNNLNDGAWHQIVGVRQGDTFSLYVDGILQASQTQTLGSVDTTSVAPTIGNGASNTDNRWFDGSIDDVRAYDRALSSQEVSQLYALGQVSMTAQSSGSGGLSGSLTASWSFDSDTVSGTTVEDLSGNGHNLTLVNGASITPGYDGDALTLDGTDQYAWGKVTALPASVALSMWVKPNDVATEQSILVEEDDGAPSSSYHFTLVGIRDGKFLAGFWDIGDIAGLNNLNAGQWYHVILTYNGVADTQSLYVDGVLQGTQSGTWSPPSDIYFLVGYPQSGCSFTSASGFCSDYAGYFNGQVDDLQGYDQAFTSSDVQALSNPPVVHVGEPSTSVVGSGLAGYWPLDGNTIDWKTGAVSDMSGAGDTLSMDGLSTTTSPTIGKIGQALEFAGSQLLSHTSVPAFNFGTGDFSVSFWMKPSSPWGAGSTLGLIGQKTSDSTNGWQIYQDSGHPGHLDMRITQQNNFLTNAAIPAGTWTYATFVRKGGATYWYINGKLDNSGTNSASLSDAGSFYIGYAPTWTAYYDGALDDVRIYNRALSTQEISQLYAAGK